MGKCPSCHQLVTYVRLTASQIHADTGEQWVGVNYLCPTCETILSVAIDPVALKADTVTGVIRRLREG